LNPKRIKPTKPSSELNKTTQPAAAMNIIEWGQRKILK
jgi:hypothetical protein